MQDYKSTTQVNSFAQGAQPWENDESSANLESKEIKPKPYAKPTIYDYEINITEPWPKVFPPLIKGGESTVMEDPFAMPTVEAVSMTESKDSIVDIKFNKLKYGKGGYIKNVLGTIHISIPSDGYTYDIKGIIKQLASLSLTQKDLYSLYTWLNQIPALHMAMDAIGVHNLQSEYKEQREIYLKEEQRNLLRTPIGTTGTHDGKTYVVYENEVRWGGSWAWRCNNPGNITKGSVYGEYGAIGYTPKFAIFPDLATGRAALRSLLRDKYGSLGIQAAMKKYAPSADGNDPVKYAKDLENETGIPATTKIEDLSDTQLDSFATAIERFEGTIEGTSYKCGGTAKLPTWVQDLLQCP